MFLPNVMKKNTLLQWINEKVPTLFGLVPLLTLKNVEKYQPVFPKTQDHVLKGPVLSILRFLFSTFKKLKLENLDAFFLKDYSN